MIHRSYFYSKTSIPIILFVGFFIFLSLITTRAEAATLINASNTITTSRPSASTPLAADASSGDTIASVFDNGSFFLASDSAKIINGDTDALVDIGTIVASQSANLQTIYFAETIGSNAFEGINVLMVPITAMHHLRFTIPTGIPTDGEILISFPALLAGDANNDASPSASTFQLNDMPTNAGTLIHIVDDGTDITSDTTITATNPAGAGDSPEILITIDSGSVALGSVIDIFIGCTTISAGSCSAQSPTLINPTKSAGAGVADIWKVNIQTKDDNGINLDNATLAIGTIESVAVRATVDPTLSFTISGINNGSAINTGNTTGCGLTETTNSGINSTPTEVNLGLLANTPSGTDVKVGNIAAQRININTNAPNGYVLTATSSGQLINPATGFFLESSTTPTAFPSDDSDWFGMHACGLDVDANLWTSTNNNACNTFISGSTDPICLYAWPNTISPLIIASDSVGPIGNSITTGNGVVSISYAASVDPAIPPGEYRTIITYVATPAF